MDSYSPTEYSGKSNMEEVPQMPPAGRRKSLMELAPSPAEDPIGENNPQVMALKGLKMLEMGAQLIASSLPQLTQPVMQFVQQLQSIAPQAMAQSASGTAQGPQGPSPVPQMPPQ